tara:strand:+ start:1041 stop:1868 length:828 start_codon:yes stop_codon:yes gene_type:complete
MSLVTTELAGTRTINRPAEGDTTATREFIVYDDDGFIPTISDILLNSGLPSMGMAHPDIGGIYANAYNLRLSPDRKNTWLVTWDYSPIIPPDYQEDDTDPIDEPTDGEDAITATAFNVNIGQTVIDIWRSDPDVPVGTGVPSLTADIGGNEVHERGLPISFALPTAEISASITVFTNNFNGSGFLNNVTKRNSDSWLGFPVGSLLFKGVSISRPEPNKFDITYQISWDKWNHLRQVPKRAEDGNPEYVSTESPTLNVYWRQPFPDSTSFGFIPQA